MATTTPNATTLENPPRKIALLLGAGFSYDLGMPLAREVTEVLLGPFAERNVKQMLSAMSRARSYAADRPINAPALSECFEVLRAFKAANQPNYEAMLAQLEALVNRYNVSQSDRTPRDTSWRGRMN